jgi:hypothetical protein
MKNISDLYINLLNFQCVSLLVNSIVSMLTWGISKITSLLLLKASQAVLSTFYKMLVSICIPLWKVTRASWNIPYRFYHVTEYIFLRNNSLSSDCLAILRRCLSTPRSIYYIVVIPYWMFSYGVVTLCLSWSDQLVVLNSCNTWTDWLDLSHLIEVSYQ